MPHDHTIVRRRPIGAWPGGHGRLSLAGLAIMTGGLLLLGHMRMGVAPSAQAPTAGWVGHPGLLVRGHSQHVAGRLADGTPVDGVLYPALPGVNTLRLRVAGDNRGPMGPVDVVATMPGMAMHPVTSVLAVQGGHDAGTIALPMFGRYVGRIVVPERHGDWIGTVTLGVPLLLGR